MIMEDEDFGYTRRDEAVLERVDDKKRSNNQSGNSCRTCASCRSSGGNNRSVDERRTSEDIGSVVNGPPDIPNVVEYHLKVKPSPTSESRQVQSSSRANRGEEMKKESVESGKDLVSKLSRLSIDKNVFEGSTELPQVFQVKYLGSHDARGLWGIKHTRRPVDNMVTAAKSLPTNAMLPLIKLVVSGDGVAILPVDKRRIDQSNGHTRVYPIETISYGVQDLVYTRVFSMIVVREEMAGKEIGQRRSCPFECHGFVCESKLHARQLTYALATAFEMYSRSVKARDKVVELNEKARRRFAIDLRSPEEIEADLCMDSEA